jgi:hypothetical protein
MEISVIQFTFFALAIFYGIIAVLFIYLFYRLITKKIKFKVTVAFYIGILFAAISRATTFFVLYLSGSTIDNNMLYVILLAPDMINVCVYLFLVWNYFTYYVYCHINLANDNTNIFLSDDDIPSISNKTNILLYCISSTYFVSFIVFVFLTRYEILREDFLPIINSIFNILTPVIAIAYYLYLLIKYSGSPFKNNKVKGLIYKSSIICVVWTVARFTSGIISIIKSKFYIQQAIEQLTKATDDVLFYSIVIIIFFGITEFIPILLTLDTSVIDFYIISSNNNTKKRFIEILVEQQNTDLENPNINSVDNSNNKISIDEKDKRKESNNTNYVDPKPNFVVIHQDFIVRNKDYSIVSLMFPEKRNSLGSIHKGTLSSLDIAIRVIMFERLSRYEIEAFNKDIDEIM